jgi:ATP-dependent RNA helicase SUPV3L1/SUV3
MITTTDGILTALLGPTNTGKTYRAVERLLTHHSGVIGFPLRLLARENYDRLVALKGREAVALVTGEEKIIPIFARYFVCTVESIPSHFQGDHEFDFVAIDEIQLCADPDRGPVFTERLLKMRGRKETLFLGAETIRPVLQKLLPECQIETQQRFSQLSYSGSQKISKLSPRTALVAFTINDLYALAELLRRHRGGTAIVLGALSPRTRNKQVEMYQSGEVDFMVATDAIGMGLNMDIHHVAFASLRKFDGADYRRLNAAEFAQIAGRAGRYQKNGTFGVTGTTPDLSEEEIESIESHNFEPISALFWRNANLDFSSAKNLLRSLDAGSGHPLLIKGWPADDYLALQKLMQREDIAVQLKSENQVRLLWDICQIPDFRKTLSEQHQELIATLFHYLNGNNKFLPEDWVKSQIERLNKTEGDVDGLMARISHIRTWTYIAYRPDWLQHAQEWQVLTRAIEDKLSDALHDGLTKRFVDRRSTSLLRGKNEGLGLLAGVRADGSIVVEGHEIGHLQGFHFIPDTKVSGSELKLMMNIARTSLKQEIKNRMSQFLNALPKQITLKDEGVLYYQKDPTNPLPGEPVARLKKGATILQPDLDLLHTDLLDGADEKQAYEFLSNWLKAHIFTSLQILMDLVSDESVSGAVRGIGFQLFEKMGLVPRAQVDDLIATLTTEDRKILRQKKVKLGPVLVFCPDLNKPASVRLRALLWCLFHDKNLPAQTPRDGAVSTQIDTAQADADFYAAIGYPIYGPRSIRIDMLDRVMNTIYDTADKGKFRAQHKMAEWFGCSIADLYAILEAMGHKRIATPKIIPTSEIVESEPKMADAGVEVGAEALSVSVSEADEKPKTENPKPVLDEFILRKGKAHLSDEQNKPAIKHINTEKKFSSDKKEKWKNTFKAKKPEDEKESKSNPKFSDSKKKKFKEREGENRRENMGSKGDQGRVYSAQAKVEDNPFAILQQLKK